MRPGKPLRRNTPLRSRSGLSSGGNLTRTPMPRQAKPINPTSSKRRAQNVARRAAEAALGRVGTVGVCARCGAYGPVNGHERVGRAQGGAPTKPDCLLCVPCNTWCEDNPVTAVATGWKISRKYSRDRYLAANQAMRTDGLLWIFVDGAL